MPAFPGKPYPLGATWDGRGVNFAIYSENAQKVELCLFHSIKDKQEYTRIELKYHTNQIWHCYLEVIRPGQLYGYRMDGPWEPENGLRFNPAKLLVDPYAKSIARNVTQWHDSMYDYDRKQATEKAESYVRNDQDNAAYAALCAVVDSSFTWGNDQRPNIAWNDTILYEVHTKSFTQNFPDIPPEFRGCYSAFATDPVIKYFKELGITSLEFLPIHQFIDDPFLLNKGLKNYWGYSTLSYFAPHMEYSTKALDSVHEFKIMVRALHDAGIEVILDVVYNHTCEGNHTGPTLSMRGIDNKTYYRHMPDNEFLYKDYTGCGNTLNMTNPKVLQLIMDSLRYWVEDMHVDGFRFDLASALAREFHDVDKLGAFFDTIHQDPVVSQVKLIAEPWDLGEGGYQVGNFPIHWTEWNGKYRDTVRRYWSGQKGQTRKLATRLLGSSDLYAPDGRSPSASINFVTCHDGFTLNDLVSYEKKMNHANLEENRDGNNDNHNWNCGIEGETNNKDILTLRERQMRNHMATLILSQGVPMLNGGDEIMHSKKGNNNTYCQDNDYNYYNWNLDTPQKNFLEFTKKLIAIRKSNGVLRRRSFLSGTRLPDNDFNDVIWLREDGQEWNDSHWDNPDLKVIAMLLPEEGISDVNQDGLLMQGTTFLVMFNGASIDVDFLMPENTATNRWYCAFDTSDAHKETGLEITNAGEYYHLEAHSVAAFGIDRRDPETTGVCRI